MKGDLEEMRWNMAIIWAINAEKNILHDKDDETQET